MSYLELSAFSDNYFKKTTPKHSSCFRLVAVNCLYDIALTIAVIAERRHVAVIPLNCSLTTTTTYSCNMSHHFLPPYHLEEIVICYMLNLLLLQL